MSKVSTQLREFTTIFRDFVVNGVASSIVTPIIVRIVIYRLAGLSVKSLSVSPRCTFIGSKVRIGEGTFINRGTYFDASNRIEIGNHCAIGMEVMFCTANHVYDNPQKRGGNVTSRPIHVGDGCWIGARVCIMPGVTIGTGCVIAAGAVVTKDCAEHGLYAGNPAKRIKDLVE